MTTLGDAQIARELCPAQIVRPKQMSNQYRGAHAFSQPAIVDLLKLTDSQVEAVSHILPTIRTKVVAVEEQLKPVYTTTIDDERWAFYQQIEQTIDDGAAASVATLDQNQRELGKR